jgi:acyl carrier protein
MVFDKISAMLADRLGIDASGITPASKFSDLGVDSLDVMELLMLMEDEFGRQIELEGERLETLADLTQLVERKIGE